MSNEYLTATPKPGKVFFKMCAKFRRWPDGKPLFWESPLIIKSFEGDYWITGLFNAAVLRGDFKGKTVERA